MKPLIDRRKVEKLIEKYITDPIDGFPEGLIKKELEWLPLHINRYIKTLKLLPSFNRSREIRVLEVGILAGHLTIAVSELFGYRGYGVDLEGEETPYWIKRFNKNGIEFKTCDITREPLPFDNEYFDMVLFCEILEHLEVPARDILSEMNRVIKTGGALILTTPNLVRIENRARFLLGTNPTDLRAFNPPVGHCREYVAGELYQVLEKSGFKVEEIFYDYIPYRRWFLDLLYLVVKLIPSLRNMIMVRANKVSDVETDISKPILLTDFKPSFWQMIKRLFKPAIRN